MEKELSIYQRISMRHLHTLFLISLVSLAACSHVATKGEDPRKPANAKQVSPAFITAVASKMPPSTVSTAVAAQNLVCWDSLLTTTPLKTDYLIGVHLNSPIEHAADVAYAGAVKTEGKVSVYAVTDGQLSLVSEAPARFGKENKGFGSDLTVSFLLPQGDENSRMRLRPANGEYRGDMYITGANGLWLQPNGTVVCQLK
jgi:hypothetical protein